jgi:hypothetical protein
VSPWNILCILSLNILVEYRTVVTTVTLTAEVEAVSRVVWKGTHEALQCLPEVGSCSLSSVCCQCQIWVGVSSACANILSVVRACSVWKGNDCASKTLLKRYRSDLGYVTYDDGST